MDKQKLDKPYDNGSKRLLAICAQDLLNWLAHGAVFTGKCSEEFQSMTIEADAMHETLWSKERAFAHFEIQSSPDPDMAQRLLEYYTLAYRRYQCPIVSYVIYLRSGGKLPQPPLVRIAPGGEEILRYHYKVILLWDTPYEEVMEMGLFPLVPLARGGATREVIEAVLERIMPVHDTISREMLSLTNLFASLAFKDKEDQEWLERKIAMLDEILREAPLYQRLVKEGLEEGKAKGLAEGKAEGLAEGLAEGKAEGLAEGRALTARRAILAIFQERFPGLSEQAQAKVGRLNDPETLEQLLIKVALALTVGDAQRCLLALEQGGNKEQG